MIRDLCLLIYGAWVGMLLMLLVLVCLPKGHSGMVDIPVRTISGQYLEVRVYTEPLEGDGYVINVKRPDDPPGECWGTTIYPLVDK